LRKRGEEDRKKSGKGPMPSRTMKTVGRGGEGLLEKEEP